MAVSAYGGGMVFLMAGMLCFAAPLFGGQDPPLPVPAYPNWTLRQIDQKTDAEGKTQGVLFQYVSNDPADKIVRFYEAATARQATFSNVSAMYTVYGADGTMINVIGPRDGVPELDQAGESAWSGSGNRWSRSCGFRW